MSDRVKEAFEALIEQMEDPPTWQHIRVHEARPRPETRRPRSVWVAAAGFVVVLAFGAIGIFLTNVTEPASVTVPYVQLDWSNQVEMRCEGMEIVDNGGFESATLEMWGPTADEVIRVDATAPDGTVETLIVRMNQAGQPVQVWASHEDDSDSVFWVSECTSATGNATRSISMADPPIHSRAGFPQEFLGFPFQLLDGTTVDLADFLSAYTDSEREDTWRGIPVTVFVTSDEFTDEFGANDRTEEVWVDLEDRRYERYFLDYDIEMLGHIVLTIETVDRSDASVDQEFFSTDGLILTHDATGADDAADQPVNTTLSDRGSN